MLVAAESRCNLAWLAAVDRTVRDIVDVVDAEEEHDDVVDEANCCDGFADAVDTASFLLAEDAAADLASLHRSDHHDADSAVAVAVSGNAVVEDYVDYCA